jgi:hypothetical protein
MSGERAAPPGRAAVIVYGGFFMPIFTRQPFGSRNNPGAEPEQNNKK